MPLVIDLARLVVVHPLLVVDRSPAAPVAPVAPVVEPVAAAAPACPVAEEDEGTDEDVYRRHRGHWEIVDAIGGEMEMDDEAKEVLVEPETLSVAAAVVVVAGRDDAPAEDVEPVIVDEDVVGGVGHASYVGIEQLVLVLGPGPELALEPALVHVHAEPELAPAEPPHAEPVAAVVVVAVEPVAATVAPAPKTLPHSSPVHPASASHAVAAPVVYPVEMVVAAAAAVVAVSVVIVRPRPSDSAVDRLVAHVAHAHTDGHTRPFVPVPLRLLLPLRRLDLDRDRDLDQDRDRDEADAADLADSASRIAVGVSANEPVERGTQPWPVCNQSPCRRGIGSHGRRGMKRVLGGVMN